MPGPTAHPLRPVTADEVAAFERDGVVHLPAILPAVWIDHLVDPVEAAIADPVITTDMTALQARAVAIARLSYSTRLSQRAAAAGMGVAARSTGRCCWTAPRAVCGERPLHLGVLSELSGAE